MMGSCSLHLSLNVVVCDGLVTSLLVERLQTGKMKMACSSETLSCISETTRCYKPKDHSPNLDIHTRAYINCPAGAGT